jgi:hypothetical protein
MRDVLAGIELNTEEIAWFALGMRALAACDGLSTGELTLISDFEREIGARPGHARDFDVAATPLQSQAAREAFVKTLTMLALVDGQVSARESAFLAEVAAGLSISPERRAAIDRDARIALLRGLTGVRTFRAQAEAIGRRLGLMEADIAEVLG